MRGCDLTGLQEGEVQCQTTLEALWTWSELRLLPVWGPFFLLATATPGAQMYCFSENPAPPGSIMLPNLFCKPT